MSDIVWSIDPRRDDLGNLTSVLQPNGVTTTCTYDDLNRLTDLSAAGATVHVSEGPPADAARSAAGELAGALCAPVAVIARRSVLDAQA